MKFHFLFPCPTPRFHKVVYRSRCKQAIKFDARIYIPYNTLALRGQQAKRGMDKQHTNKSRIVMRYFFNFLEAFYRDLLSDFCSKWAFRKTVMSLRLVIALMAISEFNLQPCSGGTIQENVGNRTQNAAEQLRGNQESEGTQRNQEAQNSAVPPKSTGSISISEYTPRPMLQVKQTNIVASRYSAIDLHTHFRIKTKGSRETIENYVNEVMNPRNIAICVSLDGLLGSEDEHLKLVGGSLQDRFGVFVHLNFQGNGSSDDFGSWACNQPGFVRLVVEQLKEAKRRGCLGVKFFKEFGLGYRDGRGDLLAIDDPRFDPIWEICGELKMPILIHTADPAAFFEPVDANNERAEELLRNPNWSFADPKFPRRQELLEARNRIIERHPDTTFICAHVANNPEDLNAVAVWLDQFPNMYVDIASRISELGRKPFSAREFMIKYSDRILFATDGPWPSERIGYYWRFLESQDEFFPYSEKRPLPQGSWFIYGMNLPDSALQNIYFRNALRILPTLAPQYQRYLDQRGINLD